MIFLVFSTNQCYQMKSMIRNFPQLMRNVLTVSKRKKLGEREPSLLR